MHKLLLAFVILLGLHSQALALSYTTAESVDHKAMGSYGYYGTLGPYGNLGDIGPFYLNSKEVEDFFNDLSDKLKDQDGYKKAKKDLEKMVKQIVDHTANPLSKHGILCSLDNVPKSILGMTGPGGPLGPTGPLGSIGLVGAQGAHLFTRGENGQWFYNDGYECVRDQSHPNVCRKIVVDCNSGKKTFDLHEAYTEQFAQSKMDNDSSFMVKGETTLGQVDSYEFVTNEKEQVSLLLVPVDPVHNFYDAMRILWTSALQGFEVPNVFPLGMGAFATEFPLPWPPGIPVLYNHERSFDNFDIQVELTMPNGEKHSIQSQSTERPDWVQVTVPAGTKFKVNVSLRSHWLSTTQSLVYGRDTRSQSAPVPYRLIVVGAPDFQ